ncbi:uncharacterized protein EV154DRAFT_495299 [Mucor mucedo]|uniref:uncharacterized protein n=1 Tax=Mucor mucedo TaxID=29922 RepID=UPI00221EB80A|nr:uncharacterized protein EV154DRAFT_495299 [Mucor mucedo]KAI7895557.1 hypothetical protein EV154DRAFT_495299 [Mucor mucedo]
MLSSLLDYDFYIHGTFIGKFDFINANCLQETHVCIQNYENMTDAVRVKKSKDFPDGMIDYYFSDNRDVAMRTLLDLGPNIQQIQLIDVATIYIEYYLDIILSNQHKDLHSIVFHSHITQPFVRTDYVFKSSIQNISFRHRRLSNNALRDLSALFTNLKVVHFKACQFDQSSNDNTINIIMPDTAIDQLWVSCGVIFHKLFQDEYPKRWDPDMLPLVSITLTEEGVKRFYYTILDKGIPVVLETTRTHFHLLAKATPNYKAMTKIIKVYVKSVRELSLKLNNDRSKDILMMF